MARKLIEAQEEERAAVASELHNYIDRLLLLSANLDGVGQNSLSEMNKQILEATHHIKDLVMNIQDLSNRLHSSRLEYLGLAGATVALCKELSHEKKVDIQFSSEDMPKKMPDDVSLCLFRVLQGALQNALAHSGSQTINVFLRGDPNGIQLTVQDAGVGFDMEDASKAPAIGIAIMKERVKLAGGKFAVESQRGRGTTIRAHVPLVGGMVSVEASA
jgi:signal transduction histidine kinase